MQSKRTWHSGRTDVHLAQWTHRSALGTDAKRTPAQWTHPPADAQWTQDGHMAPTGRTQPRAHVDAQWAQDTHVLDAFFSWQYCRYAGERREVRRPSTIFKSSLLGYIFALWAIPKKIPPPPPPMDELSKI